MGVATVSGFSVDSKSGVLTPRLACHSKKEILRFSRGTSEEYLFVIGATADILSVYQIDSTGSLSLVSNTSIPAMSYVRASTVTKLQ